MFRVELELHSAPLRKHSIQTLDDFIYLPEVICPKHVQFVEIDWQRLRKYLGERFGADEAQIAAEARKRSASLRRVRGYLRKRGVVNFHRWLVPLPLNKDVTRALERWAKGFKDTT